MQDMQLLTDGPEDAPWTLILAHGAGQGMRSEFLDWFAQRLAGAGQRVVRFQFPYMQAMAADGKRRPPDRESVLLDSWRAAIGALAAEGVDRRRLVIGGKSLGGRMASLIADQEGVAGLVCLGYPFHPPGRPERLRTEHLLGRATRTLICQGTRDPFGSREEVATYTLSAQIGFCWLEDGEHGFKPRKAAGVTHADNLETAAAAILRLLDSLEAGV